MEQGSDHRPVIIRAVVLPGEARIVLDGVCQIPHAPSRPADKLLHDAVFEECGFEGPLLFHTAEIVPLAGGTGPDLGDVSVDRRQIDQRALR